MFLEPHHHTNDQVISVKKKLLALGSSAHGCHICFWNDGGNRGDSPKHWGFLHTQPGLVPFHFPWAVPHISLISSHSSQLATLLPSSLSPHPMADAYGAQLLLCRGSQGPIRQVLLLHSTGETSAETSSSFLVTQLVINEVRI